MKKIFKNTLNLLKEKIYLYPLIITCLFSFGYVLTHSTINIDTLSFDRYLSTELLSQGRFMVPLIHKITNLYSFNPFFLDLLSVFIFAYAITFFCAFIKEISKNKFKTISYTIMACLFISYPLLPEIFTYTPTGLNIALGYLLTFFSAYMVYYYKGKSKLGFSLSFLPLMCAISLYESFASVYLLVIAIIFYFDSYKHTKIKDLIKKNWTYIIPLLFAVILNSLISNMIIALANLEKSENAAKNIYYLIYPLKDCIKLFFYSVINNYILPIKYYLPITMLFISIVLSFIFFSTQSLLKKNSSMLLSYLLIILSTFSLSLIQGNAAAYRTCQTFPLLVGFTFLAITNYSIHYKKNYLKVFILIFSTLLIFYQSKDMHKWFYINDLRYQEEKEVLINIANNLHNGNYNLEKPVIPLGSYTLSKNIKNKIYYTTDIFSRKIGQTNVNSYLNWAINAFNEPGTELFKLWNYLGYDFVLGTNNMKSEAIDYAISNDLKNGDIVELDNYIIVCFEMNNFKIIYKK